MTSLENLKFLVLDPILPMSKLLQQVKNIFPPNEPFPCNIQPWLQKHHGPSRFLLQRDPGRSLKIMCIVWAYPSTHIPLQAHERMWYPAAPAHARTFILSGHEKFHPHGRRPAPTGPTRPAPCPDCWMVNPDIQIPFNFWVVKLRPKMSLAFIVQPHKTGGDHLQPPLSGDINPCLSDEAFLNWVFDFNHTLLSPPGTKEVIFEGPGALCTFSQHVVDVWYLGPALEHYQCYTVCVPKTCYENVAKNRYFPTRLPCPGSFLFRCGPLRNR